jgi:hypothetical protein
LRHRAAVVDQEENNRRSDLGLYCLTLILTFLLDSELVIIAHKIHLFTFVLLLAKSTVPLVVSLPILRNRTFLVLLSTRSYLLDEHPLAVLTLRYRIVASHHMRHSVEVYLERVYLLACALVGLGVQIV